MPAFQTEIIDFYRIFSGTPFSIMADVAALLMQSHNAGTDAAAA